MHRGTAVLAYDCKGLRVLPNCKASGTYRYVGMPPREQVVQLVDRDELAANLPQAGPGLGLDLQSELSHGGAIDLASVVVGKMGSATRFVKSADLLGDCQGATHIVAEAFVGASALVPGKPGHMRSATGAFDAVADALLNPKGKTIAAAIGDPEACKGATPEARSAPEHCGAPIRLHLTKIGAMPNLASENSANPPVECARGLVMSQGKCTHLKAGVLHPCDPRDSKDCAEQCKLGHAGSCFTLGASYDEGNGGRTDMAKAADLYSRACDAGDAAACLRLGVMTEAGKGVARDPKRAAILHEKACGEGKIEACLKLGVMFETGAGVSEDLARAVALYERTCDQGLQAGCDQLAHVYGSAKGYSEQLRRAKQAYLDACYSAEPAACASLSIFAAAAESQPDPDESPRALHVPLDTRRDLYDRACGDDAPSSCLGRLVEAEKACAKHSEYHCLTLAFVYYGLADFEDKRLPKDLDRAALMFERDCNYGDDIGCADLGLMVSEGDRVPRDPKRGAELKERACNNGSPDSCANFAIELESGKNVPKDVARAFEMYREACRSGVGGVCNRLGWRYLLGVGVTKNTKQGLTLIKSGCELHFNTSHQACNSLAFAQLNGMGTKPNDRQTLALFEKECEFGLEESCLFAGFMHLFGRGTEQNKPKAESLFKAGCSKDRIAAWEEACAEHDPEPEECAAVGLMWHTGVCGKVDRERASKLLAKACHGGWSWACQRAKEFKASP